MRKSDKRPCGRFNVNFCKWTASEKWSLVNEILQGKLLKIASDRPTADLMQISKNGWRQTDTNNPGQRLKLVEFKTIRRKCANRTSGPVPDLLQILATWTGSEKWPIVNEILIGNLMKIASDNPCPI